jgi:hypothetical protein
MEPSDWGPVAELASALKLHEYEHRYVWFSRLGRTGTPWQHFGRTPAPGFWPAKLAGTIPAESPRLLSWRGWRILPPAVVDSATLRRLLPACHSWLAIENVRYLASWFAPDAVFLPDTSLLSTSDLGLVWSLASWAGFKYGPAAILSEKEMLQKFAPKESASAGDLLTIHRNIEALAVHWLNNSKKHPASETIQSRGGGLRRESILLALKSLSTNHHEALEFLITHSPLTWMAYLDVISQVPPADLFKSLKETLPSYEAKSMRWLALLADTLFGALLSPNPAWGDWQRAAEELKRSAHWGWLRTLFQLKRLQDKCSRLRKQTHDHFLARMEAWQGLSTCLELHVMTLDRMVRTAGVRGVHAMREEWKKVKQEDANAWAAVELFRRESAYNKDLSRLLLGASLDEIINILSPDELRRLMEILENMLNIQVPEKPSLPIGRFLSEDEGLRLPFRPPNHRGPSAAAIISDLLLGFLQTLEALLTPPENEGESEYA